MNMMVDCIDSHKACKGPTLKSKPTRGHIQTARSTGDSTPDPNTTTTTVLPKHANLMALGVTACWVEWIL